jgi:hypothetical protein
MYLWLWLWWYMCVCIFTLVLQSGIYGHKYGFRYGGTCTYVYTCWCHTQAWDAVTIGSVCTCFASCNATGPYWYGHDSSHGPQYCFPQGSLHYSCSLNCSCSFHYSCSLHYSCSIHCSCILLSCSLHYSCSLPSCSLNYSHIFPVHTSRIPSCHQQICPCESGCMPTPLHAHTTACLHYTQLHTCFVTFGVQASSHALRRRGDLYTTGSY